VLSALINLGYQRAAAEKAIGRAASPSGPTGFDGLFRQALALLS